MPSFAGLHFFLCMHFLMTCPCFTMKVLRQGWKDLRKALLEVKMWWCLTDQLPVVGIFDSLLENNYGGSSILHHCSLITTSFQNAYQSFVSLSPHNFAIVSTFARPQVGSDCISASLSNFLFKQRNHSSQGNLIEELYIDEEGSKCLHFVKA